MTSSRRGSQLKGNIFERQTQLTNVLTQDGWSIKEKKVEDLDWWADEQWLIESQWSPVGFQLFLTFLVEPMWTGNRKKGQGIWAIGAAVQRPADRWEQDCLVQVNPNWTKHLAEFITRLSALRDQAA